MGIVLSGSIHGREGGSRGLVHSSYCLQILWLVRRRAWLGLGQKVGSLLEKFGPILGYLVVR